MKLDYHKTQQFLSQKYAGSQAFLENILSPIFSNYEWVSSENRSELDEEEELRPIAEQIGIEEVLQVGYFEHEEEIEPFYLFDITVRDSVQMSRNRVGVQRIIRRILDDFSHAFMLFHYEDTDRWDWRFSYCHKGGTNEVDSDAKRYTYLLGPGQTCRTATQRFVDLSKNETLSLKAIQDAFNVEALSDEFFNKYREHYADIVQYITGKRYVKQSGKWVEKKLNEPCEEIYSQFRDNFAAPDKTVRDYIKKLMGRLVFLQFLQKKGWIGVPADRTDWIGGDPEFLQNSWNNYEDKVHFIDNFLEPLFSDLDTKRKNDIASKAVGAGIKIPYLNGGLFELDQEDVIEMPMPEEYIGGILQFFSEYNFTIDENDPNDAQVGVDPEMLGRIFENLLEDNKDKGAYYTPKPIVKYMCTESLIAYLKTGLEDNEKAIRDFVKEHEVESLPTEIREKIRQKLRNVKICDPAIGSGAFPVGLLNELFLCLGALETFKNPAEIKKHIIQNSIYGVDIEKGAVDIARLRFWLSIVVDEPTPETLPNLDFKIMQGNSLLEQYQGYDLSKLTSLDTVIEMADGKPVSTTLFGSEVDTKRIELRNLLKEYYSLSDKYEKDHKRDEIKVCVEEQLKADNTNLNLQDIDVAGNDQFFLWHTWFSDVFNRPSDCSGFDIVIGNPPYFLYQETHLGEISALRTISQYKSAFGGKLNAYKLFIALGINCLLSINGILCYICQNSFLSDKQASNLRKQIINNYRIVSIDSFPERDSVRKRVFESVKMSVCIPIIQKIRIQDNLHFPVNIWNDKDKTSGLLTNFSPNDIISIDPQEYSIPRLALEHIGLIKKLISKRYISLKCYEGELNMTFHKKYFTDDTSCPKILKGASIQRYYYSLIMSQGEIEYLDEALYIKDFARSEKSRHHNQRRIAMQGMTGANDKLRIIMSIVPAGYYLANSCNYILENGDIDIYALLAILNSKLINWFFRCFSTNSNVNGYEVENLPIPQLTSDDITSLTCLSKEIVKIKEKSPQEDVSNIEIKIDKLVYKIYGLTQEEIAMVVK